MASVMCKGISAEACSLVAGTILRQERFRPVLNGRGYCRGLQTEIADVHTPLHATSLQKSTIETAIGG